MILDIILVTIIFLAYKYSYSKGWKKGYSEGWEEAGGNDIPCHERNF